MVAQEVAVIVIKDRKLIFAIFYLALLCFGAILVLFLPFDPNHFNTASVGRAMHPSLMHPLGTDDFGRDLLLRALFGAQISLMVGFSSVLISVSVGACVGLLSGYGPSWIDELVMRTVDFLMALPTLFILLALQVIFKPSFVTIILVIGLSSWMGTARLIRSEVLSIKKRVFVKAAKARGISTFRIIFKHILPHTLPPLLVASLLGVGSAILTESVLSFLGLGIQPPRASWGNMLENSLSYIREAPWMLIVPGTFITLTVLSLNFLGDFLRKMFSPREHQV